jgi:S1-C subfamily serine protease
VNDFHPNDVFNIDVGWEEPVPTEGENLESAAQGVGHGPSASWSRGRCWLVGLLVGSLIGGPLSALVVLSAAHPKRVTVVEGPSFSISAVPLDAAAVLARAQPSVVSIATDTETGSGVIVSSDGLVLTNNHVVNKAITIKVTQSDGTSSDADFVGSIPDNDVAIVRMRAVTGLTPAVLGSSAAVRVGDDVLAIGNALGLAGSTSVTRGIVSAKERIVDGANGVHLEHMLQTDAAINRGNSGGALVNAAGQVVGISTLVAGEAQNVGFALAIDEVAPLVASITSGRSPVKGKAFLGVGSEPVGSVDPALLRRYGVTSISGAFVHEVLPASTADTAGIKPGDVIVGFGGVRVTATVGLAALLAGHQPGESVAIEYERRGVLHTVEAKLGSRAGG